MDYSKLPTEMQNPMSSSLDSLSVEQILRLMDNEDSRLPRAVRRVNAQIAQAARLMVDSIKKGGRIFLVGAGTSGRLGVLEASECPPTFNTPSGLVQFVMAGGRRAVFCSQEGAEDRAVEAKRKIRKLIKKNDIVVGISASGVTPFVRGALGEAKKRGVQTVLLACNLRSPLRSLANVVIAPQVGPEVIAGSTRLKAGTATKLILNRLTVASMVQMGKVYGNLMVDLQPRSRKLEARALGILKRLGGVSNQKAKLIFKKSRGRVKAAILMARKNLSYDQALSRLKKADGFLKKALH